MDTHSVKSDLAEIYSESSLRLFFAVLYEYIIYLYPHTHMHTHFSLEVYFFFFKFYLFIYFWLRWVFVATHGLSLVAASGGYSL